MDEQTNKSGQRDWFVNLFVHLSSSMFVHLLLSQIFFDFPKKNTYVFLEDSLGFYIDVGWNQMKKKVSGGKTLEKQTNK